MANVFKNTDLVAKIIVKEFINSLQLGGKVDRQLDGTKVFNKVGGTVDIRRPVMFKSTDGAVIESGDTSDIEEATIPVVLDQRKKVVFSITTQDATLSVEDATSRYLRPAGIELAQDVESSIADTYKNIPNFSGVPGVSPGTFLSVANVGAVLDDLGVPMGEERTAFYDPQASATLADGLRTVFPQNIARKAIEKAAIGLYAGFDLFRNQSLKIHTVGVNTGTPLVNGADQNVTYATAKDTDTQVLNTDGWTNDITGILLAGDVFTLAGVNSVNRRSREDTGRLAQFVVTADADSGAATGPAALTINPPIIIDGPYQTVTAAPANNAAITVLTGTGGSKHRQNLAFHRNAITLAIVQLDIPLDKNVSASRQNFMNVSVRVINKYNITTDEDVFRVDILYAVKVQNSAFAIRTTS